MSCPRVSWFIIVASQVRTEAAEKIFLDDPRNAIQGEDVRTPKPILLDRENGVSAFIKHGTGCWIMQWC